MMLWLIACQAPVQPAPPVDTVAAPTAPTLPLNASIDAQVQQIYQGSDRFSADASGTAMRAVKAIGPPALPELLRLVRRATDDRALHSLCSGINTLDVREPLAAPILLKTLNRSPTTVAACGAAAANTLPVGSEHAQTLVELTRDGHRPCWVREAVANSLREPGLCSDLLGRIEQSGCSGRVAIRASGSCPGAAERLLALGPGPHEEAVMAALLEQTSLPASALGPLRRRLESGPLDNSAAHAITLIGRHGSKTDLPLLKSIIPRDPHGAAGFHAKQATEAIAQLQTR